MQFQFPIKLSTRFSYNFEKLFPETHRKCKGPRIAKTVKKKREKEEEREN